MPLVVIASVIYLATIGERLLEVHVSNRNAAWSFKRGGIEYGADHYKWMVAMHAAFLLAMMAECLVYGVGVGPTVQIAAILIAVLCQVMRWWIIRTLGNQWNTRVIIVPGLARVTGGPYRFLDHPNYVVVAIETLALPLIFGSWRTSILFTILNAIMMVVRIRVEDKALGGLGASGTLKMPAIRGGSGG